MATRKMSGKEGYKTGPVKFGKEDFRSGKVDEVRQKVKLEEMRRDPILASGPDSPPPLVSVPELQQQIKNLQETLDKTQAQHIDEVTQLANRLSDNRDEMKDLREQLAEAQSDYDASELQSLREDLEDLNRDIGDYVEEIASLKADIVERDAEIISLKTEIQEMEEEDIAPTIPRAIRLQSIKSIKKIETDEDREDEFRVLAEVSSPTISTAETQLRFPVSQLQIIQNAINR
jgi:chromosome segregation ATPase